MSQSNLQRSAAENLQVIRSLMERATIYEAISAPSALCTSLVAFIIAALTWSTSSPAFLAAWLGAVALTSGINAVFIARSSRSRNEPFFSPGMRHTLRSVSPPLLAGALIGSTLILTSGQYLLAVSLWVTFYGIALLAMQGFAPKPITGLGIAFTLTGIGLTTTTLATPAWINPSILMASTFGLFHLGYAICVPLTKRTGE